MRNLKRALSLTLASVMLLGMMVVGSNAAVGYDDVSETDNVEAIEVLQSVEVMVGDERGFGPERPVTRAEMAVVMGKLLNLDYNYYTATCPFDDVYDWARGWVGACAANGIVSGRGDGIYDPGATVTAVEAASMLMRALGYFQYSNDYAAGFEVATVLQGTNIGIFDGVGSSATEPMTRNQVAQIVLNALQSGMVEPDGNTTTFLNPDGTVLATTGKVNYVFRTSNKAFAKAISGIQATSIGSQNTDPIVELGEQLYDGDLRLDSYDNDVFGRPSRTWEFKGEQIGTYVKKELLKQSYTTEVTGKELYELLSKKTVEEYDFEIYIDGIDVDEGKAVLENNGYFTEGNLVRTNTRGVGATGNGVLTEVYVDNNPEVYNSNSNTPGIVYIAVMNTYLAKANEDYNEKKDEVNFTIWNLAERNNGGTTCLVKDVKDAYSNATRAASGEYFDVEGIQKNDIYLVRVADNAIQKMYDPEIIADTTLSSFSVGNWVSNGTKYDYADAAEYDDKVLDEYDYPNMKEVTYDIYLDMFGYMIGIEQNEDPDQYVFLTGIDVGASNLTTKTADANIIHMDGTMETVTVDMTKSLAGCYKTTGHEKHGLLYHSGNRGDGTARNLSQMNTWCTYTVGTNGVYTLKEVPYGTGADTLGQYAQGAADQPDSATATDTKTISEKRTSLIASIKADGAVESWVYGNDDTVYINVELNGVRVKDTYDHVEGDGINGEYRMIIDDVDTVAIGIKDVDIEVNTLPATETNQAGGTEYYNPDKEIFTLYKEGIVLGAVTIGVDNGSAATWAYIISDKPRQEDYEHVTGSASKTADPGEWTWYREAIVDGKIDDLIEVGDSLEWIGTPEKSQGIMREGEWYEVKIDSNGHVRKAQTLEEALNPADADGNRPEKRYLTQSKNVEEQINTENGDVALHMLFTKADYVADHDTLTFKNGNLYTNSDLTKGFSVSRNVVVVLAQAELKSGEPEGNHGVEASVDQFKVVNDTYTGYDGLKAALDRMKSSSANFVGDLNVIFHNGAASVIIINDIWGDYINEGGDRNEGVDSNVDVTLDLTGLLADAKVYDKTNVEIEPTAIRGGNRFTVKAGATVTVVDADITNAEFDYTATAGALANISKDADDQSLTFTVNKTAVVNGLLKTGAGKTQTLTLIGSLLVNDSSGTNNKVTVYEGDSTLTVKTGKIVKQMIDGAPVDTAVYEITGGTSVMISSGAFTSGGGTYTIGTTDVKLNDNSNTDTITFKMPNDALTLNLTAADTFDVGTGTAPVARYTVTTANNIEGTWELDANTKGTLNKNGDTLVPTGATITLTKNGDGAVVIQDAKYKSLASGAAVGTDWFDATDATATNKQITVATADIKLYSASKVTLKGTNVTAKNPAGGGVVDLAATVTEGYYVALETPLTLAKGSFTGLVVNTDASGLKHGNDQGTSYTVTGKDAVTIAGAYKLTLGAGVTATYNTDKTIGAGETYVDAAGGALTLAASETANKGVVAYTAGLKYSAGAEVTTVADNRTVDGEYRAFTKVTLADDIAEVSYFNTDTSSKTALVTGNTAAKTILVDGSWGQQLTAIGKTNNAAGKVVKVTGATETGDPVESTSTTAAYTTFKVGDAVVALDEDAK